MLVIISKVLKIAKTKPKILHGPMSFFKKYKRILNGMVTLSYLFIF